jgi:predicted GTPase
MSIDSQVDFIKQKLDEDLKTTVSVALFGQPGAGKSSLINRLVGRTVAEVGVETDKTVKLEWYESNGLNFADLPGYGTANFPAETYFEDFNISQFDLFLCVTNGKFRKADTEFFQELKRIGKTCIFVFNQRNSLHQEDEHGNEIPVEKLEQRKLDDIVKQVGQKIEVVFTTCQPSKEVYGLERVLKVQKTALKPSEHQIYHSNMNEGSA